MLTTLDKAVAWAQTKSMWPDTFGLACCAIEMMSIVSSRYDIARFGMEAFRSSPRQADLLIVSGRVSHKMAAPLRQIYDQMLEPKWVIAMGACASSGGMFNNYAVLQGVDKIVAVDIHVPGCPPRPEALMEGIIRLHEKVAGRRAARVRDPRGRLVVTYEGVPGVVETSEAARRDDARRRAGAQLVEACTHLRDELGFNFLSDVTATDYLGWAEQGRRRLHRHPPGPRHQRARLAGPARAARQPKPKRFAMNYHLLALARGAAARARAGVARRRRAGRRASSRLADRRLARARGLGHDGHPVRRPPEPGADPDGGRLGGPPAAQGLPDRRRAGPVLGARSRWRPSPAPRRAIYEGTRIPSPDPDRAPAPAGAPRLGRHADGQLRAEPPVDARRAAADRRPRRRERRRPRAR